MRLIEIEPSISMIRTKVTSWQLSDTYTMKTVRVHVQSESI